MITRTFGTHTVCFFQTPAGVIAVRGRAYEKELWEEEAAS